MIGDQRAAGAPPCDSLAEAVVLSHLLRHPQRIGDVDLGQLLVFPEHRQCWQALSRVWMRQGAAEPALFLLAWLDELERIEPGKSMLLWHSIQSDGTAWARAEQEWRANLPPNGEIDGLTEHLHGFDWWLARLRRVAEARQLISAAQRMAERAWREDVEGAREVASIQAQEKAHLAWQAVIEI